MKKVIIAVVAVTSCAQVALASNVGVGIDIHIGNQPSAPVAVPVPVPTPAPVVVDEPPLFLYPPELGFGVAVDIGFDLFFVSGFYYTNRGDAWYRSSYYNGPWVVTGYRALPPGLRRHKFEKIRYYRDREYNAYRADHDRYRGRHFRPEKGHRRMEHEQRRDDRRQWKEDRRRDREEGRHGRHGGRDR